jgi:hypothetical protein
MIVPTAPRLYPPLGTMMSAYRFLVLSDHRLHGALPLLDISFQTADEAQVGVGVHVDAQIHDAA